MRIGERLVDLTSLEHQGKNGKLLSTRVDVNARKVVAEDIFDGIVRIVPLGIVDFQQQVEEFGQDMS